MAKLIVRNPQRAKLKTTGFIGQPEGDIILSENNKTTNVSSFATATVRVPEPTGTLLITENGEQIDIKDKEFVDVAVPLPSGEITLDKNNQSYNVTDYVIANVAIPEEEKTVKPSNAQQDVTPDNGLLRKVTVEPTPLEERTVTPTSQQQVVVPTAPNIGFSSVTVEGYLPEEFQGIDMLSFEAHKGYRQSNGSISGNGTDPNWVWFDPVDVGCKTQVIFRLWGYPTVMSLMVWNENNEIIDTVHISSGSTYFYNKYSIPTGAKKIGASCFSTITRADQMCVLI